jgi:hypothetical protein
MKGIKLAWAPWRRPDPACAPVRAKAAGLYMICTLSKHHAEAKGCSDALMLDWRGQLAETTGASMVLVQDGVRQTPKADCLLDGRLQRPACVRVHLLGCQLGTAFGRRPPRIARMSSPANSYGVRASTTWVWPASMRSIISAFQISSPATGFNASTAGDNTVGSFEIGRPAAYQASSPPWKTRPCLPPK